LVDGGDRNVQVAVAEDWQVRGLEPEDAVAHFDTLDGRTLVEPSNRVWLYAPRFGSVRKVFSLVQDEQTDRISDVHRLVVPVRCEDIAEAATSKQEIQPGRNIGARPAVIYKGRQRDGALVLALGLRSFHNDFKPYENLQIIRQGVVEGAESAYLAKGVAAAITWSHDKAVQVVLDRQMAAEDVSDRAAWTIYTVDQPPPCPRLRLVKVASTQFAEPGDTIDFTLRFDNVGNQPIGNVTILDDLTTRLEYVPDSAQSSLEATFRAEPNGAGSQVLRWEIKDPLPAGQGGVIRFRCRVR
jgi:uncharacterized repeat protein (TIGR01451 family)